MNKSKLLAEFEAARDDLGLEIIAPYQVDIGSGVNVHAVLLLRNFGGSEGMLVVTDFGAIKPHLEKLARLGYGFSVLDEPRDPLNERYDRASFIDMLSDWSWTGDADKRPGWIKEVPS